MLPLRGVQKERLADLCVLDVAPGCPRDVVGCTGQ